MHTAYLAAAHHPTVAHVAHVGVGVVALLCLGLAVLVDMFGLFGSQKWGNVLAFFAALAWWRIALESTPLQRWVVDGVTVPLQHFAGEMVGKANPELGKAVSANGVWILFGVVLVITAATLLPKKTEKVIGGIANREITSAHVWYVSLSIVLFSALLPFHMDHGMAVVLNWIVSAWGSVWSEVFTLLGG